MTCPKLKAHHSPIVSSASAAASWLRSSVAGACACAGLAFAFDTPLTSCLPGTLPLTPLTRGSCNKLECVVRFGVSELLCRRETLELRCSLQQAR